MLILLVTVGCGGKESSKDKPSAPRPQIITAQNGSQMVELTRFDQGGGVGDLAWSPDGSKIAFACCQNAVRIWDVASKKQLAELQGHTKGVASLKWSPDGTRLASGGYDATVRIWDVASSTEQALLDGPTYDVRAIAWSPDGTRMAGVGGQDKVWFWDISSKTPHSVSVPDNGTCEHVAWSPDGTRIAASCYTTVYVWDANTLSQTAVMQGHAGMIWNVFWSKDGQQLASQSIDGTDRVWDAATGGEVRTLHGHTGPVETLSLSDGTRLSASIFNYNSDHKIFIINEATKKTVATLVSPTHAINSIAWSPNGTMLASGSGDGTVRLWGVPGSN